MANLPFDSEEAAKINKARMDALKSFNLCQPETRVLELGAGVGKLSEYLTGWGCEVVAIEGRDDTIAEAEERYPALNIRKGDVTNLPRNLGEFDLVLAFGIMYHLPDPMPMLRAAIEHAPVIALETIVTDAKGADLRPHIEPQAADQSLVGMGCRPTPEFVVEALKEVGYKYIYEPEAPPDYQDYRWEPQYDGKSRRPHNLRKMYVASAKSLWKSKYPGLVKI